MLRPTPLLAAALALSPPILATSSPDAAAVVAAEPARAVRAVQPRQTTDPGGDNGSPPPPDNLLSGLLALAGEFDLTPCLPGALGLVGELPPIPSGLLNNDVITQVLEQTTLASDQVCSFTITGTEGALVTSFLPTWYSWYSAHSSTISEIISQYGCTRATDLVHTVEAYETCPAVSGIIASGITASPASSTTTGDNSAGASSSPTSAATAAADAPPNAASGLRADGVAVAVALVACVLAAVAQ